MKNIPNDVHSKVVDEWEIKSLKGLSIDQQMSLFLKAIHAVEKRAVLTLSSITLMVILDRVLHQCTEKYPFLSLVVVESKTLNFKKLHEDTTQSQKDLIESFRYLLKELLRVLGRITADILTVPLHKELLKVSWTDPEKK